MTLRFIVQGKKNTCPVDFVRMEEGYESSSLREIKSKSIGLSTGAGPRADGQVGVQSSIMVV